MSLKYYDRKHNELDVLTWARMLEDRNYARVAYDRVDDALVVSTVWIGLDHRLPWEREQDLAPGPLIFETAVFEDDGKTRVRLSVARTANVKDALQMHEYMLSEAKDEDGGPIPPPSR